MKKKKKIKIPESKKRLPSDRYEELGVDSLLNQSDTMWLESEFAKRAGKLLSHLHDIGVSVTVRDHGGLGVCGGVDVVLNYDGGQTRYGSYWHLLSDLTRLYKMKIDGTSKTHIEALGRHYA